MSFTTVEAKKLFFLTADDLHALPRTTLYGGFGTGRASYLFNETDLEAAAIAKYGETGYARKVAARQKRLDNKRRRDEEAAAAEASFLKSNPDVAAKKRKQEENAKKLVEQNKKIQGEKPWNLVIISPESVAGTKAVLMMKDFPPIGWPGKKSDRTCMCVCMCYIRIFHISSYALCSSLIPTFSTDSSYVSCSGDSPANSYGNIHGFKGKSSEEDKEMVFETKWKL